ncbi:4-alpha-glucanotransferase [Leptolyngbya sp. FACHB-36]|uniref:4-alpha-glucanotransferase n=1 Tax=Leptolyngbya sp. FACHB-36 TaxID=2692808 RepID=UPI00168147B6|nr:4-alpha-glucanotransferase [Leptolyngbya sp. FACHB-36]MBD2020205.1 4-alpha-glucanotransferase [Leptolyngbya sp. FACHB-36]
MTRSPVTQAPVKLHRVSGLLLHPTSFPGRFGIGDLGPEARQFIDFLADSGQQLWQVLPLGPTGFGNSPYMCYSALAGNPMLISPERLRHDGLLDDGDLANFPEFSPDRVEYDRVVAAKTPLLQTACENFKQRATSEQRSQFQQFCDSKAYWLDDYALFMALKRDQQGSSWHTWEPDLAHRKPEVLEQYSRRLTAEIFYEKFLQFEFFYQWSELRRYANSKNIQIIGDIPIYVAHDSADVWANPENFSLDETGKPALMAGVPPDYFSETGQLWGNPVYEWEHLQKSEFHWWVQRFRAMLDYVDLIRIDHFRGFEAFWAVDQGEETAMNGRWIKAPGMEFFEVLREKLGKLPILAEDLGVITPEVEELRDRFEFPGMKILQFAFGSDPGNPYLPFNFSRNSVVYTGTHDNNTTVGWFESLSSHERENVLGYLGCTSPEGIHWDLIRLALSSISNTAIIPVQDLLGFGSDARMNVPSKAEGNWQWRYHSHALTSEIRDRLCKLTKLCGRAPAHWGH